MKIVHVINRFLPNIGGAELYVYRLSKKLIERGYESCVVTTTSTKFRGIEGAKLPRSEIIDGIKVLRAPAYLSGPSLVLSPLIRQLVREVNDADIYNVHGLLSNISIEAVCEIKRRLKKPVVLTTHDIKVAENLIIYMPLWKLYIRTLGYYLVKESDTIVCQNPEDASYIIKTLKIPPTKVHVLPCGVDTEFFNPIRVTEEEKESFIQKMGIDCKKVVLFVGRLEARKRIDLLLLAMKLVVKKRTDTILLIVGPDQGILSQLVALSKKLGLEKHVKFCGKLTDQELRITYAISDVSVSLSAQEAFGLTLVESMAMERPVVSHRWKGIQYVVVDGVNGFLVNPFDYKDLAKKVLHLLENDSYRVSLGRKAREYVLNNFSLDVIVDRIIHVYNSVLRR
ncbi:MAG: glycosyltransferase family 4 protein [Thermofilaceae archaeon]